MLTLPSNPGLASSRGAPIEIEPAVAQAGREKGVPGTLIITFYDNDQLEGVLDGIRRGSRSR